MNKVIDFSMLKKKCILPIIALGILVFPTNTLNTSANVNLSPNIIIKDSINKIKNTSPHTLQEKLNQKEATHVKSLYLENKITYNTYLTYKRVKPYWNHIRDLEKELMIVDEFKWVIGAESDFDHNKMSKDNAFGIGQITAHKLKCFRQKMKGDLWIISEIFDKSKVDQLNLSEYDLNHLDESINFEELGFKQQNYEKISKVIGLGLGQMKYVIIPRYILVKRVLLNYEINENDVYENPICNLNTAYAIYLSNKLELRPLLLINDTDYIHKSESFFTKNGQNLRAFDMTAIIASYNSGIQKVRDDKRELYKTGSKDNILSLAHDETKWHNGRWKIYAWRFDKLKKYGIFVKDPYCL